MMRQTWDWWMLPKFTSPRTIALYRSSFGVWALPLQRMLCAHGRTSGRFKLYSLATPTFNLLWVLYFPTWILPSMTNGSHRLCGYSLHIFSFKGGKKVWQHIAKAWKVMGKMNPFLLLLDSRNILQLICNGLLSTKVVYLPLQWIGRLSCTRNVLGTSKIFGIPIVMISLLGRRLGSSSLVKVYKGFWTNSLVHYRTFKDWYISQVDRRGVL